MSPGRQGNSPQNNHQCESWGGWHPDIERGTVPGEGPWHFYSEPPSCPPWVPSARSPPIGTEAMLEVDGSWHVTVATPCATASRPQCPLPLLDKVSKGLDDGMLLALSSCPTSRTTGMTGQGLAGCLPGVFSYTASLVRNQGLASSGRLRTQPHCTL